MKLQPIEQNIIVAKAFDGQRYPFALFEFMWICDGEKGSGLKEANDLCCF